MPLTLSEEAKLGINRDNELMNRVCAACGNLAGMILYNALTPPPTQNQILWAGSILGNPLPSNTLNINQYYAVCLQMAADPNSDYASLVNGSYPSDAVIGGMVLDYINLFFQ